MKKRTAQNTITVGMTTYNSEKYVIEQLESIFEQSVKPDEIVICDDGSIDRTVELINGFMEKHTEIPIQLYENAENLGYMKNFEKCFGLCSGDIIIPCDSDDVWCTDKIKRITEVFDDNEVVYAFHEVSVTDEHLNVIKPYLYKDTSLASEYKDSEKIILRDIRRRGMPNGMSMAFRSSLMEKIRPFYIEHDGWIDICASLFGKVEFIPETLTFYRRHVGALSGHRGRPVYSALKQTKHERFHMSPVLLEGYSAFHEKFRERLSDRIIAELKNRIAFEKTLCRIAEERRMKAAFLLLGLYNRGYTKYRGSIKLMCMDLINVLTHSE